MRYPDDYINKIIYGNSIEVMKGIPKECIDLTVTSPPYDNLRDYKGYDFDFEGIANGLYRVTKQGGVVVWVVGDETIKGSETGTSFKQALYFKEIGFDLHDTMIYEKSGVQPSNTRYCQMFEYMFVFSKGKPKSINLICDKKNNWGNTKTGNIGQRQVNGEIIKRGIKNIKEYGMRYNIWRIINEGGFQNKDKLTINHPATFPEQLAQDHIISWSNKGDIVLDPMCGSGTTCKMAKKLGRKYMGIDISEEYCELSRRRVNATPEPLF